MGGRETGPEGSVGAHPAMICRLCLWVKSICETIGVARTCCPDTSLHVMLVEPCRFPLFAPAYPILETISHRSAVLRSTCQCIQSEAQHKNNGRQSHTARVDPEVLTRATTMRSRLNEVAVLDRLNNLRTAHDNETNGCKGYRYCKHMVRPLGSCMMCRLGTYSP